MGAEAAIIGGAVVSFLFIYTMNKLDDKHFLLKIILLFFSAISVLLIGQGVMAGQANCSWLPDNSTISGSTTTYDYSYHCDNTPIGANKGVLTLTTWYFRILTLYAVYYFLYMVFKWATEQAKAGRFSKRKK